MEDCQKLRDENQKLLTQLNPNVNVKRCSVAVDSEDEICSFCRENLHLQPTIVLPRCGHSFHRSCFSKYKEVRCPLCRTPTEEEPSISGGICFHLGRRIWLDGAFHLLSLRRINRIEEGQLNAPCTSVARHSGLYLNCLETSIINSANYKDRFWFDIWDHSQSEFWAKKAFRL